MKFSEETVNKFLAFIAKEKSLSAVCAEMEMNQYEVLGLVSYVKSHGINIAIKKAFDDISMINMGDIDICPACGAPRTTGVSVCQNCGIKLPPLNPTKARNNKFTPEKI